jgi:alkaline phosphatase D
MKHEKRSFLKTLAVAGASLPFLPLSVRQALARNETGGNPRLMDGPMIGAVTPTSARLWMRASGRFPVAVRYGLSPDLKDARMTAPIDATPDNDFVTQFLIEGLQQIP